MPRTLRPSDNYASVEFSDGILRGRILKKKGECGHCHESATLIWIEEIKMPKEVEPSQKFILFQDNPRVDPIGAVGITCGCYAKAMRQIAYVLARRKAKDK